MPELAEQQLARPLGSDGLIADRQLVCVQTFDIARLTSSPVALVPSSFVALGGRGPRGDSNETCKTSFLAAVSLLLGDPEWRMGGGGAAAAAALLFEPETAGVAAQTHASARQGYVIGVFAQPEEPETSAVTVWCRINATTPYFQVRWAPGVHLVTGGSDRERHRRADADWDAMPSSSELGPHGYVEELYGDTPRCLAYVARRGKRHSGDSLLKMNAGGFSPEQIGEDLIRLTGRAAAFETEREHRMRLDEVQRALAERQLNDERTRRSEDDDLAGVNARDEARALLGQAETTWSLHFARGLLDVLAGEEKLLADREQLQAALAGRTTELANAERELKQLSKPGDLQKRADETTKKWHGLRDENDRASGRHRETRAAVEQATERLRELEAAAEGWEGADVPVCEAELQQKNRAHADARESLGAAKAAHREAERVRAAAKAGDEGEAGAVLRVLAGASIPSRALMDVEIEAAARDEWEPRLRLYRDAVVVEKQFAEHTIAALADRPGAVVVSGEADAALPRGVVSAPPGAGAFLTALSEQMRAATAPPRAEESGLGVVVIGGFPTPQAGRAARLARAEEALRAAAAELEGAERHLNAGELAARQASDELARAVAAAQLPAAREAVSDTEAAADEARLAVDALVEPLQQVEDERVVAVARLENYDQRLKDAEEVAAARRGRRADAERELAANRRSLDALQVDYWRKSWGSSPEEAEAALAEERRTEKTLRNRTSELLNDALSAVGVRSDGEGAPTPELAEVARRRRRLDEDVEAGRAPVTFEQVVQPLRDWLDSYSDADVVVAERIARSRERRHRELEITTRDCGQLESDVDALQDAVEQRIRQALDAIGEQYDRLNRASGWFGAELEIRPTRPQGPQDRWRWRVTPRWRRSSTGRMLPYDNQANTAQEKLATVQLVLAALLAAPNPRGRVLVLDELGDSLGVSHRREVLKEIAETAREKGVTVLGTCQDSVLSDAAGYCGELLYFEYPSYAEALNRPTRMFGFDENGERVELTADAVLDGRAWL